MLFFRKDFSIGEIVAFCLTNFAVAYIMSASVLLTYTDNVILRVATVVCRVILLLGIFYFVQRNRVQEYSFCACSLFFPVGYSL